MSMTKVMSDAKPSAPPKTDTCDTCGREYATGEWPFCPHGSPNYGWKFAQGQNPARREAFFKQAAENPFGI